ncbi:glycoside hydrolase [Favolaschia claudopus]|uniref:Glycoside hydrolase n=1 Tax=Favolaschia claudopus TaxID=2862362 RepID=A0AAW0BZ46_9AGAR
MSKPHKVLLLGPTGYTGNSILLGLLNDRDSYQVSVLVRPSSASKPAVQKIKDELGVPVLIVDIINASMDELVKVLTGFDIFISAIDQRSQEAQLRLVQASKAAGVKRFVPCAWITVVPPGVMDARDSKQETYLEIFKAHLPYTIIDVGFWHQLSFPRVPSGRVDYACFVSPSLHGNGGTSTMMTDLRDIGPWVALILKDERTLNRYVCTYSDVLTENEIFALTEEMSGEKVERTYISAEENAASRAALEAALKADPNNEQAHLKYDFAQYDYSKYFRGDNTPAYAKYLGYLDATELYPDFRPRKFKEFMVELLEGKIARVS